jgi:spore germination cell wall hydrolase CwlJ-like protein
MGWLRTRSRGGVIAPFGLCILAGALLPASIGPQDLSALFASQAAAAVDPMVSSSPFVAVRPAVYSFPQPLGTAIPKSQDYRLASLDPAGLDLASAVPPDGVTAGRLTTAEPVAFPTVNHGLKGDLLHPPKPGASEVPVPGVRTREAHAALVPILEPEGMAGLLSDEFEADLLAAEEELPELGVPELSDSSNPAMDTARLYFGIDILGAPASVLDRPAAKLEEQVPLPAHRPAAVGETIARKGEISDEQSLSPAERLGLTAKARRKSEKCLAEAVYFESRGESVRGQIAVAQVVMNRVFSEFYPDTVCEVVYQNAHRRFACQFTFACDGIREIVRDAAAWRRAKRIARDTLDGKLWLEDVGKATHYHASWVRPWWVRSMRKLDKIGMHTFYRPRRWGSGADEPAWGDASATAEATKKL